MAPAQHTHMHTAHMHASFSLLLIPRVSSMQPPWMTVQLLSSGMGHEMHTGDGAIRDVVCVWCDACSGLPHHVGVCNVMWRRDCEGWAHVVCVYHQVSVRPQPGQQHWESCNNHKHLFYWGLNIRMGMVRCTVGDYVQPMRLECCHWSQLGTALVNRGCLIGALLAPFQ